MMRHGILGASLVLGMSACSRAATNAPPTVPTPAALEARATTSEPTRAQAPAHHHNDPPGTRRVGAGEWSLAVGEAWERRVVDGDVRYTLPLEGEQFVSVSVTTEPRQRGALEAMYDRVVDEFSRDYAAHGLIVRSQRRVSLDGVPAREIITRPLYAGETVSIFSRALVRGDRVAQLWCTAPPGRAAEARATCLRTIDTLVFGEAPSPPANEQWLRRNEAAVRIPEAWVLAPNDQDATVTARSDRSLTSITLELDFAPLQMTTRELFDTVIRTYREDPHSTLTTQHTGRARDRQWLDLEVTQQRVPAVTLMQRLVAHGDDLVGVTCVEPTSELTAGHARCAPVLDSFRFVEP